MSDIKFLDNNNEIIRIDATGFHYRGQFIEDAGEAHRLLVEFLRKHLRVRSHFTSMTDLSPAAFAVWDAAWDCPIGDCKSIEDARRHQIAAALRAAAVYCKRDKLILLSLANELEAQ